MYGTTGCSLTGNQARAHLTYKVEYNTSCVSHINVFMWLRKSMWCIEYMLLNEDTALYLYSRFYIQTNIIFEGALLIDYCL